MHHKNSNANTCQERNIFQFKNVENVGLLACCLCIILANGIPVGGLAMEIRGISRVTACRIPFNGHPCEWFKHYFVGYVTHFDLVVHWLFLVLYGVSGVLVCFGKIKPRISIEKGGIGWLCYV